MGLALENATHATASLGADASGVPDSPMRSTMRYRVKRGVYLMEEGFLKLAARR